MASRSLAVEPLIAWRYLRSRERDGFISFIAWFSLIGVALGVATLIVVLSVMNGLRSDIFGRIVGVNGHVRVTAEKGLLTNWEPALRAMAAVPGVVSITPVLERQAVMAANGATRGVQLRGMRADDFMTRDALVTNIVGGDIAGFIDKPGVVMGDRLRVLLGLRYGDKATVTTYVRTAQGHVAAKDVEYTVLAGFIVKRGEFDSTLVIVPLDLMQEDFQLPADAATSLEIAVADPRRSAALVEPLRRAAGRSDIRIADWRTLNARLVGALDVERVMMFIILSLIVLVAAMNVIASFTMLVRTKGRGIAILRTMGAGRATILRVFFMASAAVGVIGTLLGCGLGLLVCGNMKPIGRFLSWATGNSSLQRLDGDYLSSLPVRIEASEVGMVLAIALGLSLLAAIYPAWRAARLDPVEALRDE